MMAQKGRFHLASGDGSGQAKGMLSMVSLHLEGERLCWKGTHEGRGSSQFNT